MGDSSKLRACIIESRKRDKRIVHGMNMAFYDFIKEGVQSVLGGIENFSKVIDSTVCALYPENAGLEIKEPSGHVIENRAGDDNDQLVMLRLPRDLMDLLYETSESIGSSNFTQKLLLFEYTRSPFVQMRYTNVERTTPKMIRVLSSMSDTNSYHPTSPGPRGESEHPLVLLFHNRSDAMLAHRELILEYLSSVNDKVDCSEIYLWLGVSVDSATQRKLDSASCDIASLAGLGRGVHDPSNTERSNRIKEVSKALMENPVQVNSRILNAWEAKVSNLLCLGITVPIIKKEREPYNIMDVHNLINNRSLRRVRSSGIMREMVVPAEFVREFERKEQKRGRPVDLSRRALDLAPNDLLRVRSGLDITDLVDDILLSDSRGFSAEFVENALKKIPSRVLEYAEKKPPE